MYRLQNAAVALSAFSAFVASLLTTGSFMYWSCVLATIFIGSVSSVGCQGSSLSVEREWTKALCHGDSASLASLNAGIHTSFTVLLHSICCHCEDTCYMGFSNIG